MILKRLAAATASLALAACLMAPPVMAAEITVTVTHVRDGDTIEVDGTNATLRPRPSVSELPSRAQMVTLVVGTGGHPGYVG